MGNVDTFPGPDLESDRDRICQNCLQNRHILLLQVNWQELILIRKQEDQL